MNVGGNPRDWFSAVRVTYYYYNQECAGKKAEDVAITKDICGPLMGILVEPQIRNVLFDFDTKWPKQSSDVGDMIPALCGQLAKLPVLPFPSR